MRRAARITGGLLVAAGVLTLVWAIAVWQWQDPFTALYAHWQQDRLAQSLEREIAAFRPAHAGGSGPVAERRAIAADARAFRGRVVPGQSIGRIVIGRDRSPDGARERRRSRLAREGPRPRHPFVHARAEPARLHRGHRTTYLAPFGHIDAIRPGDAISLEMPYATFTYRAVRHRIVQPDDLSVLRSPRHELLELQACHPRFFASHRYVVFARLTKVEPRGGAPYTVEAAASAASG